MIIINLKEDPARSGGTELTETCFECSVCALHCVVQHVAGFNSRNTFVYDLFRSDNPAAHRALWACSSCHKCVEVCPQDVDPLSVIVRLREKAFNEGRAPAYVYDLVKLVLDTGFAFPVTKKTQKDREALGLTGPDASAVGEIRRIASRTGLLGKLREQ
jgi:heterodisulfide reductase subunit C2